jgi:hypothetical protein
MAEHEQLPSGEDMTPEEAVEYVYSDLLRARISPEDIAHMVVLMPGTGHIRDMTDAMKRAGVFISFAEIAAAQQGVELDDVLKIHEKSFGDTDSDAAYVDLIAEKILLDGMEYAVDVLEEEGNVKKDLSLGSWITVLETERHERMKAKNPTLFEKARLKAARLLGVKAMIRTYALPKELELAAAQDIPFAEENQSVVDALAAKLARDADEPFSLLARKHIGEYLVEKGLRVSPAERGLLETDFIANLRATYKSTLNPPPAQEPPAE